MLPNDSGFQLDDCGSPHVAPGNRVESGNVDSCIDVPGTEDDEVAIADEVAIVEDVVIEDNVAVAEDVNNGIDISREYSFPDSPRVAEFTDDIAEVTVCTDGVNSSFNSDPLTVIREVSEDTTNDGDEEYRRLQKQNRKRRQQEKVVKPLKAVGDLDEYEQQPRKKNRAQPPPVDLPSLKLNPKGQSRDDFVRVKGNSARGSRVDKDVVTPRTNNKITDNELISEFVDDIPYLDQVKLLLFSIYVKICSDYFFFRYSHGQKILQLLATQCEAWGNYVKTLLPPNIMTQYASLPVFQLSIMTG